MGCWKAGQHCSPASCVVVARLPASQQMAVIWVLVSQVGILQCQCASLTGQSRHGRTYPGRRLDDSSSVMSTRVRDKFRQLIHPLLSRLVPINSPDISGCHLSLTVLSFCITRFPLHHISFSNRSNSSHACSSLLQILR